MAIIIVSIIQQEEVTNMPEKKTVKPAPKTTAPSKPAMPVKKK